MRRRVYTWRLPRPRVMGTIRDRRPLVRSLTLGEYYRIGALTDWGRRADPAPLIRRALAGEELPAWLP